MRRSPSLAFRVVPLIVRLSIAVLYTSRLRAARGSRPAQDKRSLQRKAGRLNPPRGPPTIDGDEHATPLSGRGKAASCDSSTGA